MDFIGVAIRKNDKEALDTAIKVYYPERNKFNIITHALYLCAEEKNLQMFKHLCDTYKNRIKREPISYFYTFHILSFPFEMLKYCIDKIGIFWIEDNYWYKRSIDENRKLIALKGMYKENFNKYTYLLSLGIKDVFYNI